MTNHRLGLARRKLSKVWGALSPRMVYFTSNLRLFSSLESSPVTFWNSSKMTLLTKNWTTKYFMDCLQLPEEGQKWGFLIWLVFSYCGLVCLACITTGKVSSLFWRIWNSVLSLGHLGNYLCMSPYNPVLTPHSYSERFVRSYSYSPVIAKVMWTAFLLSDPSTSSAFCS